MSKYLLATAAALMLPVVTQAEPAPAAPHATKKIDCASESTCLAEMFADALSARVAQALQLDSFVTFEAGSTRVYSASREKLQAVAASWQTHLRWSTITVGGHAGRGQGTELAQQRADKIRGYLIRYGVAAQYVVAIGDDDSPATAATAHVDLAIELCDRVSQDCQRSASVDARKSTQ